MESQLHIALAQLGQGGVFIYPLLAVGLLVVATAIDRFYVFLRYATLSRRLVRLVVTPEADWAELTAALKRMTPGNFNARFFACIVEQHDHPVWWIESHAAGEAALIEKRLDQGLWVLETMVTAAPLLGLLGTIAGMIGAFRLFGSGSAVDPAAVTGGVAEALINTGAGIVIALVALAAFNAFSHRKALLLDELERLGTGLIDRIRLEQEGAP